MQLGNGAAVQDEIHLLRSTPSRTSASAAPKSLELSSGGIDHRLLLLKAGAETNGVVARIGEVTRLNQLADLPTRRCSV